MKKTIVVSAVNIRKGGTLTILRDCLSYLSALASDGRYRIVALVHDKNLAFYSNIEYLEFPDTIKSWGRRLWCEYVTMYRVSKQLSPVYLWLSLHDTTPNVKADNRAVYCQTSFPFLKWKWQDLRFDYKILLFSLFTKFAYRFNVKRNNYLIVQADWLRLGFAKMFGLERDRFIVCPPEKCSVIGFNFSDREDKANTFIFPATPDCHKNFELLCEASFLLEKELGQGKFNVVLTIDGTENKYARWIYAKWGQVDSLKFVGFLKRKELFEQYASVDCLVFPSRIETWGLPISEFALTGKPLLLADLPYAHETACGCDSVSFFNPEDVYDLKEKMKKILLGDCSDCEKVSKLEISEPFANNWKELFDLLLNKG